MITGGVYPKIKKIMFLNTVLFQPIHGNWDCYVNNPMVSTMPKYLEYNIKVYSVTISKN